jgi:hypothetical protein
VNKSIICGGKGKDRVLLIKFLINARVRKRLLRGVSVSQPVGHGQFSMDF